MFLEILQKNINWLDLQKMISVKKKMFAYLLNTKLPLKLFSIVRSS